jgi:hypothetical protein
MTFLILIVSGLTMAAVSTPSTSLGRSCKRKQSITLKTDIEHSKMFSEEAKLPLGGAVSPSAVSELSVDSGMGGDEFREASEDLNIHTDDIIDGDDSPIYENIQFFDPSSRLNRSIENLNDAFTIDCLGSIPSPPPQFSDSIGLVNMAERSAADYRNFSEQRTGRHGQARYVEREDMVCYEGIKTSEDVDNDYDYENHGQDLSLILTTQNPSKINVQTLRKNKVRED